MNLSDIKLVASDMDGTLLNSNGELTADFFPLFERMNAQGITFAAASGRQLFSLLKQFESIKNEMVFVAENGSYILYKGEELLMQSLDPITVVKLLKKTKQIPGIYTILCGKKNAYIESTDKDFVHSLNQHYRKFEILEDLTVLPDDDFLKITICDLEGSEKNSYTYFKEMENEIQVKVSGDIWLDLSHKLANKGTALRVLQEKLDLTADQTMVFGDYLNDLEMMGEAYYSYAMENAHPAIIEAARFVTKSNDENGVVVVLEEMIETVESTATLRKSAI
ncbi:Cof-type HAD-IIB family hydrolase [Flavobacterium sp. '19STA2R22 D10 B1']|uniref:Cof-type HAD-IIB family hydrolase n=1 Tax=Flavobacterium aerium TaxID=3037261 RepID=UPI00278BBBA6|nr:Cof-type HAD-IIB family hydrolase [Flavobacterium sp. '19STA2R22 D10 B1']